MNVITVDVAIVLALVSTVMSVFNTILLQRRLSKTDTHDDTETTTRILMKLEAIEKFMNKSDAETSIRDRDFRAMNDRVIINEESMKSMWKHIEVLEMKGNRS